MEKKLQLPEDSAKGDIHSVTKPVNFLCDPYYIVVCTLKTELVDWLG